MSLLHFEFDQPPTLASALRLAGLFDPGIDPDYCSGQVAEWTDYCQRHIDPCLSLQARLNALRQVFYRHLGVTGQGSHLMSSKAAMMHQVIAYRTGGAVCLGLLFCHLGRGLGLDLSGVIFPGHYLIRHRISPSRSDFIDPLTGEQLSWTMLANLYESLTGESQDSLGEVMLQPADTRQTLIRLLQNIKAACMAEQQPEQALTACDLLVQLCPEDPYERRDRGFVYQQLDCYRGALADYRYYIRQCPQDPAAHLLKMRLRHVSPQEDVLH
ncbi:transglutaminase family protein [Bowmanella dokdonensis]|uniref:Tetratricopeptide repeat protein n=1 Tax=Bowmanella dokdonensis TaxID=751969 RepID=A0A939DLX8_9ALTE|nr:tetratricopeptide repeat protein [Bowmanella dokdonensis]